MVILLSESEAQTRRKQQEEEQATSNLSRMRHAAEVLANRTDGEIEKQCKLIQSRCASSFLFQKYSKLYNIMNQRLFDINLIFIWVYHRKWGWPNLPRPTLAAISPNSHSPSCSIHGILLLKTNILAHLLHLRPPRLLWSSSLPLALHFKLQRFSQNIPIIPPQRMHVPSHSIREKEKFQNCFFVYTEYFNYVL